MQRDIFYRRAKAVGFRARSAFKLLQVHTQCHVLSRATNAVDLCAAPGSWSQVLALMLGATNVAPRVVSVDLQPMSPITGCQLMQGDITEETTVRKIRDLVSAPAQDTDDSSVAEGKGATGLGNSACIPVHEKGVQSTVGLGTYFIGKDARDGGDVRSVSSSSGTLHTAVAGVVDVLVSDGAPDVSGDHAMDAFMHHWLMAACVRVATRVLRPDGVFVAKIFKAEHYGFLRSVLRSWFRQVVCVKPLSSRASSSEHFVVCRGFSPYLMMPARLVPRSAMAPAGASYDIETRSDDCGGQEQFDDNSIVASKTGGQLYRSGGGTRALQEHMTRFTAHGDCDGLLDLMQCADQWLSRSS